MAEIDHMDMLGFLHIRAWALRKAKEPKRRYIDQIWSQLDKKNAVTVR